MTLTTYQSPQSEEFSLDAKAGTLEVREQGPDLLPLVFLLAVEPGVPEVLSKKG